MLATLLACVLTSGVAQTTSESLRPPPATHVASLGERAAADLEPFFDGLVPYVLKRGDVAGAAIAVVAEGQVVLAKGFGVSDLASGAPMSATTLIRPGSISKLFTWTAVMQLVEQGRLDLDADLNQYLDFVIPPHFDRPITLRHLMTHTPGFEDTTKDLFVEDARALYPLRDYLIRRLPARIYPPGEIVAYSNYGTALAGYIVERVSGERYEDYVRAHIFEPLDMSRSTMIQPLPAELQPLMSKGYRSVSDATAQPYELIEPAPAGSAATTAADMARFMIAHLQNGEIDGARILDPETAVSMRRHQYAPAPDRDGFALGFFERTRNGRRTYGHDGDTLLFHSDLYLIPDANVGIFVSLNSVGNGENVRGAIIDAFMDRYFPHRLPEQPTLLDALTDAKRVTGWYVSSRHSERSLALLQAFRQLEVSAQPDGTLEVSYLTNVAGAPKRWSEVGPLTYREVGGNSYLTFVADAQGDIRYLTGDDLGPTDVLLRVRGLKQASWLNILAPLSGVILLGALAAALTGRGRSGRGQSKLYVLSRIGAAAMLIVIGGWMFLMSRMWPNLPLRMSGVMDPWLYALYGVGVVALVGAALIVLRAGMLWQSREARLSARVGELALAGTALYVVWFIVAYRLVSFDVNY